MAGTPGWVLARSSARSANKFFFQNQTPLKKLCVFRVTVSVNNLRVPRCFIQFSTFVVCISGALGEDSDESVWVAKIRVQILQNRMGFGFGLFGGSGLVLPGSGLPSLVFVP
jgi:hypothetical protein